MTDLPERNITLNLEEELPEPWELPPVPLPQDKPIIQIPGKNRTLGSFATELGQKLREAQIYQTEEGIIVPREHSTEFEKMKPARFVTWIEKRVTCVEGEANPDGSGITELSVSSSTANLVLVSDHFREQLPFVKAFNSIRQPVFTPSGQIRLLPCGYDLETRTLTARGSTEYSLNLNKADAIKTLNGLLNEFCFADKQYGTAVQLAAMLTAYVMGMLSETCVIPAFVYNANAAGVGKGLCALLTLVPVLGCAPSNTPVRSEAELEKRLFAAAKGFDSFFFVDNLDIPLQSPALESFLTSSRVSGRVLGQSSNESYAKKTMVIITGNHLTMRSDMRRRSLIVDFFLPEARAEVRRIERPMDEQSILAARPAILGSLYALVRDWVADGKPAPSRLHPSFREWSSVIAGIVEHAGFDCPIPCLDIAPDIDPETSGMDALIQLIHASGKSGGLSFRKVVALCEAHDLFSDRLPKANARRRGNTEFGRLLKRFDKRVFSNGLVFGIHGTGHARKYVVHGNAVVPPTPSIGDPATAVETPGVCAIPPRELPLVLYQPADDTHRTDATTAPAEAIAA